MDVKALLLVASVIATGNCLGDGHVESSSHDGHFPVPKMNWNLLAKEELEAALKVKPINKVAKNVILFVGDGMGISTLTAARILKGQMNGQSGEEGRLTFEKFPNVGLSKTYCVNKQVPDSASTATAFMTGQKVNFVTVAVNENVKENDPSNQKGNELTSIAHWSQDAGKATGVISTSRITHATPASAYAHSAQRSWEADFGTFEFEAKQAGVTTIAEQLVYGDTGRRLNVAMSGGRTFFTPPTWTDPEYPQFKGIRKDGKNLLDEWMKVRRQDGRSPEYVINKEELRNVDYENTDSLLGLFAPSYMEKEYDRKETEPSIVDMVEAGIKMLSKNDKGYFLLVEGGQVDKGHHATMPKWALTEAVKLDEAVEKALSMVNLEETLIIVTADHSHTFVIQGYPSRGNNILGVNDNWAGTGILDAKPYPTLGYTNGPKGRMPGSPERTNLTGAEDIDRKDYVTETLVPMAYETHGGEDVAIYANGPMAHLFHGNHEENYIAHVMAYASCVGRYKDNCAIQQQEEEEERERMEYENDIEYTRDCPDSGSSAITVTHNKSLYCLTMFALVVRILKWN